MDATNDPWYEVGNPTEEADWPVLDEEIQDIIGASENLTKDAEKLSVFVQDWLRPWSSPCLRSCPLVTVSHHSLTSCRSCACFSSRVFTIVVTYFHRFCFSGNELSLAW